jgi:predicted ATP-grasp superfamily ATP-dependent carboligase
MHINDTQTPILIVNCKIGGLAAMRSLGSQGVPVYVVHDDSTEPALKSKYCQKLFIRKYDVNEPDNFLDYLIWIGTQIKRKTILMPTSDELSAFVAEYTERLTPYFSFSRNDSYLVKQLISKHEMFMLAQKLAIPTPYTLFPQNLEEVKRFAEQVKFPIMLKGNFVNRLASRNKLRMLIVNSKDELIKNYTWLEDPDSPNLMIQEYIPGGDDQVFIFNGYFDSQSNCLAAFTGFKIRQNPIHTGSASLGECRWIEEVANLTKDFMKKIGYKGILDIGYRLDPRDKKYKVLDINPRLGAAFRLFVAENGMDVARALYLDLTGQIIPPIVPREGRKWVIEDNDIISSYRYFKEGTLNFQEWLKSYKGVEEAAWFSWKDPIPFLKISMNFVKRICKGVLKKLCLKAVI